MSKEQYLSKIASVIQGINYGKDTDEASLKRIANSLESVTKEQEKSIIEILSGGSGGGGCVPTTWAELKNLRDNSQLSPGTLYRITNYQCTVGYGYQSAGHQFDIIVLALSENTLSEDAKAALHEGDTYFADSRLEAWELKYCLDNDGTYTWVPNNEGVIYYMKDEWNNECPYDFKNVKVKPGNQVNQNVTGLDRSTFYYTFNEAFAGTKDESLTGDAHDNKISEYPQNTIPMSYSLPVCILPGSASNNILLVGCHDLYFNQSCSNNIIGQGTYACNFGQVIKFNSIGAECRAILLSNTCEHNTIEDCCDNISIGSDSKYNRVGSGCSKIRFGDASALKSYYQYIIIEQKNQNINLSCTASTSSSIAYRNVKVCQGVNTSSTVKTIIDSNYGQAYQTVYKTANDTEIDV